MSPRSITEFEPKPGSKIWNSWQAWRRAGLPYPWIRVDVQGCPPHGESDRGSGAAARYSFLARVAREQGGRCVAVGHHALDQAETILMNIARGSGARGLRGMRVLSDMPCHAGIRLVRPLLHITKDELETYCHQRNLPYRVDESNADIRFRRNFIRHEVLSRLMRLNPETLSAFERMAETAGVDEDFIAEQVERTVMPLVNVKSSRWQMNKADFAALHPALQRRYLRRYRQCRALPLPFSHRLLLI